MTEERYTTGFIYGMVSGLSALALLFIKTSFDFYQKTITLDTIVIIAVGLLALCFTVISGFRNGRVVISRRGDGFIFGFAIVFEVISLVLRLSTGKLFCIFC